MSDTRAILDSLHDLIAEAHSQGGPSPLADALSRWRDIWPWQQRRPLERELAERVMVDLLNVKAPR